MAVLNDAQEPELMRKQRVNWFKRQLLAKHQDLTKYYRESMTKTVNPVSDGSEDYVDYAVNSYTKEFLLSLNDIDRRTLREVERALKRIENNEYGICVKCEQPISEKRLEAVPWASNCIACQEIEEKKLATSVS